MSDGISDMMIEKGANRERISDVLEITQKALILAAKYNMETEVMGTALQFLKEHPDESIYTALYSGLYDWDLEWTKF